MIDHFSSTFYSWLIATQSLHVIQQQPSGWTSHVYPSNSPEYTQTHSPPAKNKGLCMRTRCCLCCFKSSRGGILKTERHAALWPLIALQPSQSHALSSFLKFDTAVNSDGRRDSGTFLEKKKMTTSDYALCYCKHCLRVPRYAVLTLCWNSSGNNLDGWCI